MKQMPVMKRGLTRRQLDIHGVVFIHLDGDFLEVYRQHLSSIHNRSFSIEDVLMEWRRMWHQAHAEILSRFQNEPQLRSLVFDIENTPYDALKQFLAEDYTLVGDALPRSGNG